MNKTVKILIACHKPGDVYHDEIYTPIHVGRAISLCKDKMSWMIGDDTGDNISKKNPYYCELTAQYWGWKNMKCDFIGLCHYRRYFETKIDFQNVYKLLGDKYDVMLVRPSYEKVSIRTRLRLATCTEDYYIFYRLLVKLYPDYQKTVDNYVKNNKVIPFNMFLMRKDIFNGFAEWQFSVLFEMEKYVHLSGYTRCRRIYGYMAEIMLPIYCEHNNLRVRYDKWVPNVGAKSTQTFIQRISRCLRKYIFAVWPETTPIDENAVNVGLTLDGIEL